MEKPLKLLFLAAAALSLLAAACTGDLADSRYPKQTLAEFKGQVLPGPNGNPHGKVSMALFWMRDNPAALMPAMGGSPPPPPSDGGVSFLSTDAGAFTLPDGGSSLPDCAAVTGQTFHLPGGPLPPVFTTQSVEYEPEFPISFSLPVHEVPGAEGRQNLAAQGGSGTLSIGFVVAYEDANHNGRYDFGKVGTPPEPILGASFQSTPNSTSAGYAVIFLDGVLPPTGLAGLPVSLPQGFTLLRFAAGAAGPTLYEVLPADSSIELSLGGAFSQLPMFLTCQDYEMDMTIKVAPRPAGAPASCAYPGARMYIWSQLDSGLTCSIRSTTGYVCLDPAAPVPADWPCQ